jgi:hypothetical protein
MKVIPNIPAVTTHFKPYSVTVTIEDKTDIQNLDYALREFLNAPLLSTAPTLLRQILAANPNK